VTGFAKGLDVVGVEEERLIALVRRDVIRDSRNHNIFVVKTEPAQWLAI
jgi:hypothetical protein